MPCISLGKHRIKAARASGDESRMLDAKEIRRRKHNLAAYNLKRAQIHANSLPKKQREAALKRLLAYAESLDW